MSDIWYYAQDDKPIGPLSLVDLKKILSLTSEPRTIRVWQPGFSDWKKAEDVPELIAVVIKPPPIKPDPIRPPPVRPSGEATSSAPDNKDEATSPEMAGLGHARDTSQSAMVRVGKATFANRVLIALTIGFVSCMAWQIYVVEELSGLVRRYGYGRVPQAMIPQGISHNGHYSYSSGICLVHRASRLHYVLLFSSL